MNGKVAVISGGAGFIGFQICRILCENGWSLGVFGSTEEKAIQTVQRLGELGKQCLPIGCDVVDTESVRSALAQTAEHFGNIDVVISMQGMPPKKEEITEITDETWNHYLASHLTGSFHMLLQSIPYLEKSPTPRVIFMASPGVFKGQWEDGLAYNAAKGGVVALAHSAAQMLSDMRITVNCLAIGGIANSYEHALDLDPEGALPLGKARTLENIKEAVLFLVSEAGSSITGEVLIYGSGEILS